MMCRDAGYMLKQTVSRQDVESKPPGMGLRRVCVACAGIRLTDQNNISNVDFTAFEFLR